MSNLIERVIFVAVIHTDLESVENVRKVVHEIKPEVVAVELDRERYQQLTNPVESEEHLSPQTTGDSAQDLMQQLAILEMSLSKVTGSNVGDEMLAAIREGRAVGAKIALVDRPMQATIRAMMRVPLNELYALINVLPDAAKDIEGGGAIDILDMLKKEGAVEDIMNQFQTEFPELAKVLIAERDEYVAKALHFILNDVKGKIVAVLGAGHIQGVKSSLERILA
ncbi:MAG: TraB/GumN family protein [Candidatus Thorarchaeota archaeon]|nr:TraB/GumN family protein [Candidatus Thorarchaeota archaeon]